jgi:hypothetical protein
MHGGGTYPGVEMPGDCSRNVGCRLWQKSRGKRGQSAAVRGIGRLARPTRVNPPRCLHAPDESLPALAGWRQGTTPNEELESAAP